MNVGGKSLVSHDGTQVGAANTNVDNGFHGLAGDTHPFAAADALSEGIHLGQLSVNVCNGILTVNDERVGGGTTQRGVEDGAVLGDINVFAGVHGVTQLSDLGLFG